MTMLAPQQPKHPVTQADLDQYENECFAVYCRCSPEALRAEMQVILESIVNLRRELHQMLTARHVERARAVADQLVLLEAQAAAGRRVHGDVSFPPQWPSSGPQDRRTERRRTARE